MKNSIQQLIDEQLQRWELARSNYEALKSVRTKELIVDGHTYKVQFNPGRIVSSAAKVDKQSIKERKCFLCTANLPPQQSGLPFNNQYQILVNPFPIFPKHLTVPDTNHVNQLILERFDDMLDLAGVASDYVIFYNGPKCGASAPDHAHFQAGNKGFLTIEAELKNNKGEVIIEEPNAILYKLNDNHRTGLIIESADKEKTIELFEKVYHALEKGNDDTEPMMNLLTWKENDKWVVCIFPRAKHRPSCYEAEGEKKLLISPASVDMGGVFITPVEEDFKKITAKDIKTILDEVCLSPKKCKELIKRIKA